MKTIFRSIILLILSLVSVLPLHAKELLTSEQTDVPSEKSALFPNFSEIFEQLRQNRVLYNAINDSLFSIEEEDDWMDLVIRRSETNLRNYHRNQQLLDSVYYYFLVPQKGVDPTRGNLQFHEGIPAVAFDSLWEALNWHYGFMDPFIGEILIGKILIPHMEQRDRTDATYHELMAHLYLNYGDCLYQMHCMGDTLALKEAYNCLRKSIKSASLCPEESRGRITGLYALCHMLARPQLDYLSGMTEEEAETLHEQLMRDLPKLRERLEKDYLANYYLSYVHLAVNYPVLKLRSKILTDALTGDSLRQEIRTVLGRVEHNELMQSIKKSRPVQEYYSSDMLFKAELGELTFEAAFDSCTNFYRDFLPVESAATFTRAFRCFVYGCQDILYMMEKSSLPDSIREKTSLMTSKNAMRLLKIRPNNQLNSQHTILLLALVRNQYLMKYLPTDYRRRYMHRCFLALSVHTLAHYTLVALYSNTVLEAVLAAHPEALVGVLGYNSIEKVRAHVKEIHDYLYYGGMLHDIGKLGMEQVINNEFRHLTDREFSIIQRHPELYYEYTSFDKALEEYAPLALGHHRWYDGSKGYPMWYDNTACRERILVDILTVADCLEAATNRMSRNYRHYKPFSLVIGEFQSQAGTRYNPVVVESLLRVKDRYHHLEVLVKNSWESVFKSLFFERGLAIED